MAAMAAEAASHMPFHQFPTSRADHSISINSSNQEPHAAMRPQQPLTISLDSHPEPTNYSQETNRKSRSTDEDDDLQQILDTTKHKHYRRRRSSVAMQPKMESQALQEEKEPTAHDAGVEHDQLKGMQQLHLQHESQERLKLQLQPVEIQAILQADMLDSSPPDLQGATLIHKPRALPLRPAVRNVPCSVSAGVKLLFEREYEWLLQWQKKDFQAFTEEVQESLGGNLKKCIKVYNTAFDLLCQPLTAATGTAAVSTSSSSHTEDGEESDDNVSLQTRQKHLASFNCGKEEKHPGNSKLRQTGNCSAGSGRKERSSKRRKLDSEAHMRDLQKQRMETLLASFVRARDAVVSIREAAHRIEEHKAWILSELNLTRLELLNLKFSRSIKPRSVLREAMELAAIVRSFVIELSSALDRDDLGAPWPLPRKADCSDVTPLFLKHLVATV